LQSRSPDDALTLLLAQQQGSIAGLTYVSDKAVAEGLATMAVSSDASVDAYLEAGLIDAHHAAWWRARFRQALKLELGARVEPVDGLAENVGEILARELPAQGESRVRFLSFLRAYELVGALTRDESADWRARIATPPVDGAPPPAPPPSLFRGDELIEVLAGPDERRRGVRVASLELYTDSVIVRWHLLPSQAFAEAGDPAPALDMNAELTDEAGTAYTRVDTPYDDSHEALAASVVFGFSRFAPAPPASARTLTVRLLGESFAIRRASPTGGTSA
jgi:hypothetical protein